MASMLGRMSEEAESMGDRIGPNNMGAANLAWALSGELRRDAMERAMEYMTYHETHH